MIKGIIILIICTSLATMIWKRTVNPLYALLNIIHRCYWYILTNGTYSIHPDDPKYKYIKFCNTINDKIKYTWVFKQLDIFDHTIGTKLRMRFGCIRMGDEYIKLNACPLCGSDLKITHGIAAVCVNYSSDETPACTYAIMGG